MALTDTSIGEQNWELQDAKMFPQGVQESLLGLPALELG